MAGVEMDHSIAQLRDFVSDHPDIEQALDVWLGPRDDESLGWRRRKVQAVVLGGLRLAIARWGASSAPMSKRGPRRCSSRPAPSPRSASTSDRSSPPAVEDGLLPRNPAAGTRLPRIEEVRAKPVAFDVLDAISEAAPAWIRIAVPLAAALGLRQSEAAGLTVDRVDFLRRTVTVDRLLLTPKSGPLVFTSPKTASSYRAIPLPTFVGEAIAAHLSEHGAGEHGLILHQANKTAMSRHRFGVTWRAATAAAGASGVRYHDPRHTFASRLLSNGVSTRAVGDWLGHASPTITLSTYSHLMPVDVDRARVVLESAFLGRSPGCSTALG